jgi:hypothetical protein
VEKSKTTKKIMAGLTLMFALSGLLLLSQKAFADYLWGFEADYYLYGGTISYAGGDSPLIARDMMVQTGIQYYLVWTGFGTRQLMDGAPFLGGHVDFQTGPCLGSYYGSGDLTYGSGGIITFTDEYGQVGLTGTFDDVSAISGGLCAHIHWQDNGCFLSQIGASTLLVYYTGGPAYPNPFSTTIQGVHLTITPIPSSLILLGSGLLSLGIYKRRRWISQS